MKGMKWVQIKKLIYLAEAAFADVSEKSEQQRVKMPITPKHT